MNPSKVSRAYDTLACSAHQPDAKMHTERSDLVEGLLLGIRHSRTPAEALQELEDTLATFDGKSDDELHAICKKAKECAKWASGESEAAMNGKLEHYLKNYETTYQLVSTTKPEKLRVHNDNVMAAKALLIMIRRKKATVCACRVHALVGMHALHGMHACMHAI